MENIKDDISAIKNEELILRKYKEGDFEEYRDLFMRVFNTNISREFFNWKYNCNPEDYLKTPIYLAFNSRGKMVGARAMFPCKINYMGKEYLAAQAGDTMVDENYRGKGIFKKLTQLAIEDLKENGCKVIFNFPNSNSYPGYIKMGWTHVGEVDQYLKVINYGRVLNNRLPKVPGISFLGKILDFFIGLNKVKHYKDYSVEALNSFTQDIRDFISFSLSNKIHQQRDEAFLSWKYINKPQCSYKIITIRRGKEIVAAFILREDENNGLKLGTIMDYFATRYEDLKVGIKILVKYCRESDFDYLSTLYITGEDYKRALESSLFFSRRTQIKFVVKPLDEGMGFITDLANWHVVYGDADTA